MEVAMSLKVCLAGATGWAGAELARGLAGTDDLQLVAAEALARPCDVFVEYTHPDTAKSNVLAALAQGAHVVVGTSGLTDADYAQIDAAARKRGRGVLACGNFALTAVLLQKFAVMAARYIPHWEIIDYAHEGKPDRSEERRVGKE